MSKRNLLICFDAFGTLFTPKRPVAQQYAEVASSLANREFTEEDVQKSFRNAFKHESKANPNYGKATGMNAEIWWTNIITNTFKPLLQHNEELPAELAPRLLHRFWSNEGYELQPGVQEALRHIRDHPAKNFDRIVVGVITNSDPRVPDVLSSLGLSISSLRYGHSEPSRKGQKYDIDFSVMSYDVGHEKPDVRIFRAAEEMLDSALKARDDTSTTRDPKAWEKVYVGDEYDKDVVGARKAGWYCVLIGEESSHEDHDVKWLDDEPVGSLMSAFWTDNSAIGFRSLQRIADWLRL